MSKTRREKHELLVLYQKATRKFNFVWPSGIPRWRQSAKARYEYVIRELKNE